MNEPARNFEELLNAALQLSTPDQARLADELLRILGPIASELDPTELERRDAELRDGRIQGLTLSEFETAMRQRLARTNP
ncbi:addiction module protein [Nannocystaceae bacterium ST9]